MRILPAVAFAGLAAWSFFGCQSLDRPQPERDAAVASGIDNAIEFRVEALPDQDASEVSAVLTLQDAIRRALRSDPAIQAALAKVRVAEAEAEQIRLLPNPVIALAFRFPEGGGSPIVDVSIAAELLSLIQKPGQVKAADFRLRAASSEAVVMVLDSLARLREKYAAVQALDALVPVLKDREKLLDQLIATADSRLRVGEGIRLDLTTLEAQRAELEVEVIEREAEREELRFQLSRLIGRPLDSLQANLEPWTEPTAMEVADDALVRSALEHRPELQAKKWELSALGVEAKQASLAMLEGSEIGVDSERDGTWSVGPSLAVPIPIFDWGQAQRSRIGALRLQTLHELTEQRRRIIEEVKTSRHMLQATLSAYRRVKERLVPLLEKRRSEAASQYRAEGDIVPLILADEELQAAKARQIELERKATESLIRLERAVGGPAYLPAIVPSTQTAPATQAATQRNEP